LYSVKVKPDAREILVFTLLSGAKEELINGRTEIDIKLTDNASGSQEKKNDEPDKVTKPADKVAGRKDIPKSGTLDFRDSKVPVYQDIYDMIRGRLPGVEVSGKSIKIRGANSLNVSTEPLFVVDGVIVGTIDNIAPETVKSIEVLKGPDATAYGTRGSNGVIVITRRTGKD
jgi:TonB-dependent SusC/RagA subfamily outer membrane receptor